MSDHPQAMTDVSTDGLAKMGSAYTELVAINEALERRNAELEGLLSRAVELIETAYSESTADEFREALSHSSETGNG